MVYALTYRRPPYVNSSCTSLNGDAKAKSFGTSTMDSKGAAMAYGIPDALSFDRIIDGGTCPPCTARDFMNYLIYIEHAAENLQFWLWCRDYTKRFAQLPQSEQSLAPVWTLEQLEADTMAINNPAVGNKGLSQEAAAVLEGTDFAPMKSTSSQNLMTPPRTPVGNRRESFATSEHGWSDDGSTLRNFGKSFQEKAAGAFQKADLKWQPFTIQPFREEISRIVSIYIADDSPRQLNLSFKERAALLHALTHTTHPSAFQKVAYTAEWSLRRQAHRNFIRWAICNGNRPRVIFARCLGIGGIVAGLMAGLLVTLSHAGRGWRILSAIGLMIGVATLIAAWKGMCVVLHGLHHRHLRPWELFAEDDDASSDMELKKASWDGVDRNISHEDEPWVAKYDKRNLVRKIFDREVWIQEPALRQIQDTIFLQALGGGLVITAIIVGILVAVPNGDFY